MSSTSARPPTQQIAATLEWETATLEDLLELSVASGVEAGDLYRAARHLAHVGTESVSYA